MWPFIDVCRCRWCLERAKQRAQEEWEQAKPNWGLVLVILAAAAGWFTIWFSLPPEWFHWW